MKNSSLVTAMLWLVALSAVASIFFFWLFISNARQVRAIQAQIAIINNNQPLINGLAVDATEYSKTNSAIDPILEAAGMRPKAARAAAAAKSATTNK